MLLYIVGFTYPAGFSFKAVEEAFRTYAIKPGDTVYDPFGGTATTNVVASQQGVRSFGVEAHPFVHFVGQTKLFWNFVFPDLLRQIDSLIDAIQSFVKKQDITAISVEKIFPELVCKCYGREKLAYSIYVVKLSICFRHRHFAILLSSA